MSQYKNEKLIYVFDINEQMVSILKPNSEILRITDNEYTQSATMFLGGEERVTEFGSCPYKEAPHTEQLNKDNFFQFWVPANHPESEHVKEENLVAFKDEDGELRLFVIKELEEIHDDILYKEVYCKAAWMDELNDEPVEDIRPQNKKASEVLASALQNTRWQVGNVAELGSYSTNFYYESVSSAIQKILSIWGGEVKDRIVVTDNKISGRFIDILPRRGADTGRRFEITKDITSLKRTVLSYPKTALYGRGKGEESGDGYSRRITFTNVEWKKENGDPVDKPLTQEWVGDPEALAQFGRINPDGSKRHRFGFVELPDEEDPSKVLLYTWDELQKRKMPIISYELLVFDLEHVPGYEHEKVRLGDTVFLIDRFFTPALLVESRVIEIIRYLNEPERTKIKLGNFLPMFSEESRISQIESKLNNRSGIWDSVTDPIEDTDYPDIVPDVPSEFTAFGLFRNVLVKWEYDASSFIAAYEVYGSQVQGFSPDVSNLLWRGKSGGFNHEADTDQQWYYRVRAINTHGTPSAFSPEITTTTVRIAGQDIQEYVITNNLIAENAAIDFAKIANVIITNAMINDASINFAKIKEVLITNAMISGQLTTSKLTVGDMTNLCPEPTFSNLGIEWTGDVTGIQSGSSTDPTPQIGKQTGRDAYGSKQFDIMGGDKFYVSVNAWSSASVQQFGIGLQFLSKDESQITWSVVRKSPNTDKTTPLSGEIVAPSWAVKGRVFTQINATSDFGDWFFTNVQVRRKVGNAWIDTISFDKGYGGTLTLGGSGNGNGRMQVLNSSNEVIADLDASTGGFQELYIGQVNSPSIYNVNNTSVTHSVTGNIGNILANTQKINNAGVTIKFMNNITEDIHITNFIGGGSIILDLNGYKLNGSIYVDSNAPQYVNIKNGTVNSKHPDYIIRVDRCSYVRIENCKLYGNTTAERGVYVHAGSSAYAENCEVYKTVSAGFACATSGQLTVQNCKGDGGEIGVHAFYGGYIYVTGTIPGGVVNIQEVSGEVSGTYTVDFGAATPPAPPETTKTWEANDSGNWSTSGYWDTDQVPKQGNWGYGRRTGYWFFPNDIDSTLTGKTIKGMRAYVKRKSSGGYSSDVTVRIRWHTYEDKPGGQPNDLDLSGSEEATVNLSWGESAWVTLPSSFYNNFASGEAKGIGIYVASDSGSNYAVMESTCKLEVTYE